MDQRTSHKIYGSAVYSVVLYGPEGYIMNGDHGVAVMELDVVLDQWRISP